MAVVTPDVVKQVALLARCRLDAQDVERFAAQLDEVLGYVKQLQELNTDAVPPTSHVLALSNVQRADEAKPSLSQDAVMGLAPAKQPPFVIVPKVIE